MNRSAVAAFASALLLFSACSGPRPAATAPAELEPLGAAVKARLSWTGTPFRVRIAGDLVRAEYSLPRFYKQRGYRPAWLSREGNAPQARALLEAIDESAADGLKPADFHRAALATLLEDLARRRNLGMELAPERLVDVELLLTDAWLTLAAQLQSGKIKPKMPGYDWYIAQNDRKELTAVLERVVSADAGGGSLSAVLKDLRPHEPQYQRLREALAEYRRLARDGGWKIVTPGQPLHRGDRDRRVALLRSRLAVTHDLAEEQPDSAPASAPSSEHDPRLFDEQLESALKRFQARHGLTDDGVLGKGTVDALNVSVLKRVRQLELNLERWRWLPRELGKRYLAVNIANFSLRAVDNGHVSLRIPVVVGNQYRHTPVFTATMTHLILNPTWFVPAKIAVEDLLPKVKKNPDYLDEHGFTVLRRKPGKGLVEVDADEIDWSKLDDAHFGYVLRQEPGATNALGRVKFMFPNSFDIYLHDTPAKDLFAKRVRSFSSGCIRVKDPLKLLSYVLAGDPSWTDEKIRAELDAGETRKVELPASIPVHILYETAWIDDGGAVQFRDDLYGQDQLLDQYL